MKRYRIIGALAVFLAIGLITTARAGGGPPAKTPTHPDVDLGTPCDTCHAKVTPQVVREWYAGKHGEFNVKCFVCHGTPKADFVLKPANDRCIGCHADQVATGGGTSCFDCHPQHKLDPHLAVPRGGGK